MAESEKGAYITGIFECYSPRLRSYIRGQVGDTDDAEDILQDVFYQLVRTAGDGAGDIEKISGWLYRVARNSILNLWRRKHEKPLSALTVYGDDPFDGLAEMLFSEPAGEPENVYLRKLVWQELDNALSELPPEQSEVFCLTVFDGVPVKDISENTGVPVATLLSRKHYAVKHLRLRLRGLYEDILNA